MDGFNSCLPARNHITLIGLSPLTSHCNTAVSPFLTVTIREGAEKYGEAMALKENVGIFIKIYYVKY